MRFLPYNCYDLETASPASDVAGRLRRKVEPPQFVRWSPSRADFEGTVTDAGFKMRPIVPFQGFVAPEIHGQFNASDRGTAIAIQVVPSLPILQVFVLLFGILVMLVFDHHALRVFCVAGSVVLLGWLLSMVGFWSTGGAIRQKLAGIFKDSGAEEE